MFMIHMLVFVIVLYELNPLIDLCLEELLHMILKPI